MKIKNTDELENELAEAKTLEEFLQRNDDHFQTENFSALIDELLAEKKMSKSILARQAGMSEVYLHQLFSGRRNPSRTKVICICIGLEATLEESQEVLRRSGMAMLYPKNKRDAVIMYGITHEMNLFQINDMLFDNDENTLI